MERIEAIQRDFPDDLRGDLIAGMIELDRARSAAALSRFNKVIENDADNVQAYYQRALLHFRQSRWPECLSDLNRTKLLAPDGFDYQHRIQLARALELSGRRDEAVSELDEIRSTAPQASRVAAALIDMYQRQERWSEAEGLLVEYTSRFPEEPDWAYRRGAFALRRNNLGEAVLWLRKATELSAYSPVVTDAYLGAVLTTGNWDEVIRFATTVLPEDRRATAAVRRSLAMAYARKGEQEKAWSAIESILAERITMTEMQRIVSDLSQVHGRTPAIELVKARHQTKPDHRGLAVLNAVMVGAVAKDAAAGLARVASLLTDAREDYEKLLLYQVAGVLHYGESQYEQARTAYEAALKIDPDDLLSLNNLAYLLASDLGEPAAALPYAEQAVMVQSQDAGALDTLGWVHYQLGNLDSAVAKLLQATQVDTNNIDGYYHLGLAYQKRGNRPDAIRSWQTAVRLSGDGGKTGSAAQARQALEELGVSLDPS
jgi:tetratricopeptide (TPR) repeat protein